LGKFASRGDIASPGHGPVWYIARRREENMQSGHTMRRPIGFYFDRSMTSTAELAQSLYRGGSSIANAAMPKAWAASATTKFVKRFDGAAISSALAASATTKSDYISSDAWHGATQPQTERRTA
jgi:hypothetical protein